MCMDLRAGGICDWTKQTIETHWFRFSESPTNTSLLPLSLSNNAVALNLIANMKTINKTQKQLPKFKPQYHMYMGFGKDPLSPNLLISILINWQLIDYVTRFLQFETPTIIDNCECIRSKWWKYSETLEGHNHEAATSNVDTSDLSSQTSHKLSHHQ